MIAIGYWPEDCVTWPIDPSWNTREKDLIVAYLLKPTTSVTHRGFSRCRICDRQNGSRNFSDGTYVWPSGLAHYLIEHNVRPPAEFVAYVLDAIARSMAGMG